MLVVVSYDVSTVDTEGRRRLRRIAKTCTSYGQRVQYSVFQCIVDPSQWARLRAQLLTIIDPDRDSLCFFFPREKLEAACGAPWRARDHRLRRAP